MPSDKRSCTKCSWRGDELELDRVRDPKDADNVWLVCPNCRTPENYEVACEHDGCWRPATCGAPTKHGYAQTCFTHRPQP